MLEFTKAVVFRLDEQRYALPLASVERIVRAAEITPLPDAPALVLGAISVEGRVLPVLDVRRRFGLPARDMSTADHFLIGRTSSRDVVLLIDEADGVIDSDPRDITAADDLAPGINHLQGVAALHDGLVLIHDLDKFLSLEDARSLDEVIVRAAQS